jgi:hypothetical protein
VDATIRSIVCLTALSKDKQYLCNKRNMTNLPGLHCWRADDHGLEEKTLSNSAVRFALDGAFWNMMI